MKIVGEVVEVILGDISVAIYIVVVVVEIIVI